MINSPTLNHPNRKAHNWLSYKIGDQCLVDNSSKIRGHIYDLGCGEMPYKLWLLNYADTYTGVDWGSTLHERKSDILADLNRPLPIENEVADTVISLSVIEHLCEPQCMLNETFRILKPNGFLLLQVPWQWHIHEAPYDFFRYTPFALKYMLAKAGYEEILVKPQSGFFTMWFTKLNYFSLRLIRGPRLISTLIKALLTPIWFIDQIISPWLDKLDRNWSAESTGFIVTARKPADHG